MPTEIICSTTGSETRVAILEDGQLAELHIDRGDERGYVGNVYQGRVVRVLPGMQAAFVDIGLERAAFLYVGDIYPELLDLHHPDATTGADGPRASTRSGQASIQDLLKEGQELLVQVAKDPIGTKGARLTTHIALPGRYVVFMPTVEHVGISRRIDQEKERRRLREVVERHRPPGAGFIVRTVCEGHPADKIRLDMDYLVGAWERIAEGATSKRAPSVVHAEHGLAVRVVRDSFDEDVARMVIDNADIYEKVCGFMEDFTPHMQERVHLYKGAEPAFDTYRVESQISRSMGRKVWLKSGGYLVIDQTEALMAIDVNSGRFVGSSSLEDTTLQLNLEAAQEVVYQLRLRNIGGLIIIDFVDMDREGNRQQVSKALEEALRTDRARTNVLRISELGLVEMTRKRVQEGLDRYLKEDCPTCSGTGVVRSRATICYDILREVQREAMRSAETTSIFVNTTPAVADLLYSERFEDLDALEKRVARTIVVRALAHYHPEQYEVYGR